HGALARAWQTPRGTGDFLQGLGVQHQANGELRPDVTKIGARSTQYGFRGLEFGFLLSRFCFSS
ncbi:MAG: hypothetical protein ACRENG_10950, partial [bacterium]